MSRRHGFTLLELMLAVMIGLLLMGIAVPSVTGLLREQGLKRSFETFDDFVRKSQARAVGEAGTLVMRWEPEGITLQHVDQAVEEDADPVEQFAFAEGSTWTLRRPAALVKNPVWEWPFWKSGACEPVIVSYEGPEGTWAAEYNGLTGRGKITDMEVK